MEQFDTYVDPEFDPEAADVDAEGTAEDTDADAEGDADAEETAEDKAAEEKDSAWTLDDLRASTDPSVEFNTRKTITLQNFEPAEVEAKPKATDADGEDLSPGDLE